MTPLVPIRVPFVPFNRLRMFPAPLFLIVSLQSLPSTDVMGHVLADRSDIYITGLQSHVPRRFLVFVSEFLHGPWLGVVILPSRIGLVFVIAMPVFPFNLQAALANTHSRQRVKRCDLISESSLFSASEQSACFSVAHFVRPL